MVGTFRDVLWEKCHKIYGGSEMEEKKVIKAEEVLEEKVEEVLENVDSASDEEAPEVVGDDQFGEVEERVVGGDADLNTMEIQLSNYDCDEILKIQNGIDELRAEVDKVAGELKRREVILARLMEREGEMYNVMSEKKREISVRYNLSEYYQWQIDPYKTTAVGRKK
jgi:hypothetical protein